MLLNPIEKKSSRGWYALEIKKNAVRNENGNIIGIVGIVDNVTERVRLEKKAEELSMIDGLTGVYNRNYLKYRVEEKKKKLIFRLQWLYPIVIIWKR